MSTCSVKPALHCQNFSINIARLQLQLNPSAGGSIPDLSIDCCSASCLRISSCASFCIVSSFVRVMDLRGINLGLQRTGPLIDSSWSRPSLGRTSENVWAGDAMVQTCNKDSRLRDKWGCFNEAYVTGAIFILCNNSHISWLSLIMPPCCNDRYIFMSKTLVAWSQIKVIFQIVKVLTLKCARNV